MNQTAFDIVIRVLLAVLLGGLIGLERELRDHPAGIRTHMLVAVGACIFTALSLYGFFGNPGGDRVAAAVVTGIGFIGAGAILRSEGGVVSGITTAASLWTCAALGMLIGTGFYVVSLVVTAVVLVVLEVIDWLIELVSRRIRIRWFILQIRGDYLENAPRKVIDLLREKRCRAKLVSYERLEGGERMCMKFRSWIFASTDIQDLTNDVYSLPGIAEVSWE